jgi:hypothetical protein
MVTVLGVVPGLAANTTVTVTPSNMQGWFFCNDQTDCSTPPSGSMVNGPATPPLGTGSARLPTTGSSDGQALILAGYQGTKLADITQLQYSTYVTSGGAAQTISLQFTLDKDVTDADDTTFYGRLVFEPYQGTPTGTVASGVWQTWSPLQGRWWGTTSGNPSAQRPFGAACPQASPCTWQQVLLAFPHAGIHKINPVSVVFKAGSGWTVPFDGNVDAFTIGVGGNETTYNFELTPPDTTAPDTTITSATDGNNVPVTNGGATSSTSITFGFAANESGSTFACKLDGGSFASCTSPKSYAGLAAGSHTFSVQATDAANNTDASPATFTWTVFTVAQNKDDCKGSGWQALKRADGSSFKNQGDCVSYTNNGK